MRRHLEYLSYVLRHKWFVFKAGLQTKAPLWNLIIHDWSKFLPHEWCGYVDNFYPRKLRKGEAVWVYADGGGFLGYIRDFRSPIGGASQGERPTIQVEPAGAGKAAWFWEKEVERKDQRGIAERFESAWNHHQKTNKHHWQYWVMFPDRPASGQLTRYSILPMPDRYIREMVADWMGAGRAITGKWEVAQWYARMKHEMLLHSRTRQYVEDLIVEVTGAIIPDSPALMPAYRDQVPQPNKGVRQIKEVP